MEKDQVYGRYAWVKAKIAHPRVELVRLMAYNAELNEHHVSERLSELESECQEWIEAELKADEDHNADPDPQPSFDMNCEEV